MLTIVVFIVRSFVCHAKLSSSSLLLLLVAAISVVGNASSE